jgi:hypothetical protein
VTEHRIKIAAFNPAATGRAPNEVIGIGQLLDLAANRVDVFAPILFARDVRHGRPLFGFNPGARMFHR